MAKKAKMSQCGISKTLWLIRFTRDYGATSESARVVAHDLDEALSTFRIYYLISKNSWMTGDNHYQITNIEQQPENIVLITVPYQQE